MTNKKIYNWIFILVFLLLYLINHFKILSLELQFILSLIGGGVLIYCTYQQKTTRFVSIALLTVYIIYAILFLNV